MGSQQAALELAQELGLERHCCLVSCGDWTIIKMQIAQHCLALVLFVGLVQNAVGQGTFTNLGFESPVLPLSGSMLPSQAVPGWLAYVPSGFIGYNTISLGGTSIILHDSDSPFRPALLGNYSLQLFNGFDGETAAVGQIGQIPAGSRSVRFVATSLTPVVSFGGSPITAQRIGGNARFNVFAGDISTYAGQTGELRFSQTGMLDEIFFSTLAVPEPGAVVLLSVGVILLWTRLRRGR